MNSPDSNEGASHVRDPPAPIERLLVAADAAVAEVDELPPRLGAVIDAAGELYVVTSSLPGRLARLASQLNESRHAADERDTALGHMRSIGARATGTTGDDSTLTAFADAVATFKHDHILIALRSADRAYWHERGVIDRRQGALRPAADDVRVGPRRTRVKARKTRPGVSAPECPAAGKARADTRLSPAHPSPWQASITAACSWRGMRARAFDRGLAAGVGVVDARLA